MICDLIMVFLVFLFLLHVHVRGLDLDEYREYLRLSQAISRGDLQLVRDILLDANIALEVFEASFLKACSCGQFKIVRELLQRVFDIRVNDQNERVNIETQRVGLDIVAGNGNLKIVKELCENNPELLEQIHPRNGGLAMPVVRASHAGHGDVTRYLHRNTLPKVLMQEDGYWATCLLLDAIFYGFLDIALDVFDQVRQQYRHMAVTRRPDQRSSPVRFLASKPDLFHSHCDLGFWGRLIYSCNFRRTPKWFGIKQIYELKDRHRKAHLLLQNMGTELQDIDRDIIWNEALLEVYEALREAVKNGNKEFFIEIIKCNPQLLLMSDAITGQNLFQLAVKFKKEKIFNLIYGLDDRKVTLLRSCDREQNNILHMAAHISPSDQLSKVSGGALKVQRDAQWFEEVTSLVSEHEVVQTNNEGRTPREVFEDFHEPLRKEGEEWMKYTATACSLVAALIATVTFQAIFTVPGGTDETSGKPLLIHDLHFTAFIMADTLAFFASCISVLIFLSILTSRYSFDDFIKSLPRKMILGLTILFFSMASMLVAFITALSSSMRQKPMLVVPMKPLASLPAVLFLMLQYPLLREMISSTYGKGIFHRDTKNWL